MTRKKNEFSLCSDLATFYVLLVSLLLAFIYTLVASEVWDWRVLTFSTLFFTWVGLLGLATLCFLQRYAKQLGAWHWLLLWLVVATQGLLLLTLAWWALLPGVERFWQHALAFLALSALVVRYLVLQQSSLVQAEAHRAAQVSALQARMAPHFFFNSLNSLAELVYHDPELSEQIILRLARMMRLQLKDGDVSSLQQELDFASDYAELEKMRFAERLQLSVSIEAYQDHPMPRFILQPLLENAIKYGFLSNDGTNKISVRLKVENNRYHLTICNPWLPNAKIDELGNGMAIENIRQRMSFYFGSSHSNLQLELDRFQKLATLTLWWDKP